MELVTEDGQYCSCTIGGALEPAKTVNCEILSQLLQSFVYVIYVWLNAAALAVPAGLGRKVESSM